jgi:hypothetical protein
MRPSMRPLRASVAARVLAVALLAACGNGVPKAKTVAAPGGSTDPNNWPADDKSLCDGFIHWRNNPQLEVSETVGPGSFKPNIRRIYKVIGERDDRHELILCREIDTNLDGIKDVVRTFNDKGEPSREQADTNYDGQIDDWITFADGRIAEEDVDTTMSTGRPNVWKFYLDGALSRIRRNLHCPSGKADEWEIYVKNRLERIGNDLTCDGHVDRWDRDAQLMAEEEAAQTGSGDGGTPAPAPTTGAGNGTDAVTVGTTGTISDAGAPDAGKKKKKK